MVRVVSGGEYKPGRVVADVTDFTAPSAGLAIRIQRHYDSLERGQVSDYWIWLALAIGIECPEVEGG